MSLPFSWAPTVMPPSMWATMKLHSSTFLPIFWAWMAAMPFWFSTWDWARR